MMNRMFLVSAALSGLFCFADSSNEIPQTSAKISDKPKFFSYDGTLSSFGKIGFNNVRIDKENGVYPTESFISVFGQFNTYYNLLAFIPTDSISKLEIGLGVSGGGLILDSTLRDGAAFPGTGLSGGSGLNNNYFGGYGGYLFDNFPDGYPYKDNRYFIIQNAYIDLQTNNIDLLVGRFASPYEYNTGYMQGFTASYHTGIKDNMNIRASWFSSFGRAFAYSQWLLDFYSNKMTTLKDGSSVNYGNHGLIVDFKYGNISSDSGYKTGDLITVRPSFYFYPGLFEAPALKLIYEKQFGNGYGFSTTLNTYYLHVQKEFTTAFDSSKKRYNQVVDENALNLNIILRGYIYNYDIMLGYYQNFNSANSHFGTYGNPMGFDFWTAGVYDIGASISDVVARNAISVYVNGGGTYEFKYGTFRWEIFGRITRSPRSDEENLAVTVSHTFRNGISLSLKAEFFRDTTKAGFNPGDTLPGSVPLKVARTDDRSHIFFTFDRPF